MKNCRFCQKTEPKCWFAVSSMLLLKLQLGVVEGVSKPLPVHSRRFGTVLKLDKLWVNPKTED